MVESIEPGWLSWPRDVCRTEHLARKFLFYFKRRFFRLYISIPRSTDSRPPICLRADGQAGWLAGSELPRIASSTLILFYIIQRRYIAIIVCVVYNNLMKATVTSADHVRTLNQIWMALDQMPGFVCDAWPSVHQMSDDRIIQTGPIRTRDTFVEISFDWFFQKYVSNERENII